MTAVVFDATWKRVLSKSRVCKINYMKMNILQDANPLEHLIKNPSAPKIHNFQNEKLGANRFFLYYSESSACSILWFCNAFVTKNHVTLDVFVVPLSYCSGIEKVRYAERPFSMSALQCRPMPSLMVTTNRNHDASGVFFFLFHFSYSSDNVIFL